jgi:hypothetical protein
MQGGKNWILPKDINANRFFLDSHWLEIWSNHLCPSMGPNGGSVAMDSVLAVILLRSKRKQSFTLGKIKHRSETNSINLRLVKIETKTNLVQSLKDWKGNELLVPKLLKIEAKTNWVS